MDARLNRGDLGRAEELTRFLARRGAIEARAGNVGAGIGQRHRVRPSQAAAAMGMVMCAFNHSSECRERSSTETGVCRLRSSPASSHGLLTKSEHGLVLTSAPVEPPRCCSALAPPCPSFTQTSASLRRAAVLGVSRKLCWPSPRAVSRACTCCQDADGRRSNSDTAKCCPIGVGYA